ncbi:hypothetical protein HX890_11905 [Pseudomonas gingeri]|uniref:hypothetical protein n=1 Tax=Pseudomonas gingeri TaxID=117681 RepID=UPI0015A05535|nr:hypothetical protein [Pseudomonas gingeri]NWD74809.1 hypothetical protein [Pseudomonas gingeri]
MEILRQGSNRKSGWTVIKAKKPALVSVEQDPKGGARVTINIKKTVDPEKNGEYDHEVRLSLSEISGVLDALAGIGLSKLPEEVSSGLSNSVRSLHRLAAAASGIQVSSGDGKK